MTTIVSGAGAAAAASDAELKQANRGAPTGLEDLVTDVDRFFAEHWARQPVLMRATCDLGRLISEQDMWDELDCGLLSRPYFTMFNEGVRTALNEMTRKRRVVGHEMSGYVNAQQIRADFAAGGTFKLNQVEHWHPPIRALLQGMQPNFRGGLEAFVFLSPPEKTAMPAHTDGAHVFILQIVGVKDWVVGALGAHSHSDSTLHQGDIQPETRLEMTLRPGDVLYMPHGCPHYATARGGSSVHVAITVEEPTAVDLANVYLAELLTDRRFQALMTGHQTAPMAAKIEGVREAVRTFLDTADHATMLEAAVKLRRLHR